MLLTVRNSLSLSPPLSRAHSHDRRVLEEHCAKKRWQKMVKPVFPKTFSTLLNRALARDELQDGEDSESQRAKTLKMPPPLKHRKLVFVTLHTDPHALSDDEDAEDNQALKEPDAVYERILGAVTAGSRRGKAHHISSAAERGAKSSLFAPVSPGGNSQRSTCHQTCLMN